MVVGLAMLAARFLPSLVGSLFGGDAEAVTKEVVGVAKEIFGTDDPNAIESAIAQNPQLALAFKEKLLDVKDRADQRSHERAMAEFKDRDSARGLFASSSGAIATKLAWITVVAFFAINGLAFVGMYLLLAGGFKVGNTELALTAASMFGAILGWVNAKTDVVYNFFFGSSAGSKQKTDAMTQATADAVKKVAG